MLHSHLHVAKFKAHWMIPSLFMISNAKGALFPTRLFATEKLLLRFIYSEFLSVTGFLFRWNGKFF